MAITHPEYSVAFAYDSKNNEDIDGLRNMVPDHMHTPNEFTGICESYEGRHIKLRTKTVTGGKKL